MHTKFIISTFFVVLILLALMLFFLAFIVLLYQKKKLEFEETKNRYDLELMQSQFEMNENTLQHLSREIHDNLCQQFGLAIVHLNRIVYETDHPANEKIKYAVELQKKALVDLRDISTSLSLEVIRSMGLVKAVDDQVEELKRTEQYIVDYQVQGCYIYADERKEIFILRILQEAISNVIKHAQATQINIILDFSVENTIKLTVKDNGIGFHPQPFKKSEKGGLSGGVKHMAIRAGIIEGAFSIVSAPGEGTKIDLTVPFKQEYNPTH